jgi:hypothetical protein
LNAVEPTGKPLAPLTGPDPAEHDAEHISTNQQNPMSNPSTHTIRASESPSYRRLAPAPLTGAILKAVKQAPQVREIVGGPGAPVPQDADARFEVAGVPFYVAGSRLHTNGVEFNFAGRVSGPLSNGALAVNLEGYGEGESYPMSRAERWFG